MMQPISGIHQKNNTKIEALKAAFDWFPVSLNKKKDSKNKLFQSDCRYFDTKSPIKVVTE